MLAGVVAQFGAGFVEDISQRLGGVGLDGGSPGS